jgi:4-hydroxy-2-oxoglutarate aldolase
LKQQIRQIKQNPFAASLLTKMLRGILLPVTTPFDSSGDVDRRALRSNFEGWNKTGVTGYVVLGSTGERVHLDEREYLTVVETARECITKEMAFVVGAGQQSVRATLNEVRRVSEAGADAVLLITPHFYRGAMTQGTLFGYYMAVADDARVPVLLYSMPELTGIAIAPETVARLSEHENIVGIKDSSGDIINFAETVRVVPDDFAVVTGNGSLLSAALSAGASAGILAVACIAPRLALDIYSAFEEEDHARARESQRKLTRLALGVLKRYGIAGLKAALDGLGFVGGHVRAPLQDAGEDARREIARLLEECGSVEELTGSDERYRQAGAQAE